MKNLLLVLAVGCAALALVMPAVAQEPAPFADQQSALDTRLDEALETLARERSRIAREKLPLSRSVASL